MEKELKPTIENPFGKSAGDKRVRTYVQAPTIPEDQQPRRSHYTTVNDRTAALLEREKPTPDTSAARPNFYISKATERLIEQALKDGKLVPEGLPLFFRISLILANLLTRPTPSLSDFELALRMRNREEIAAVVEGNMEFDMLRMDIKTQEVLPKAKRILFWRNFATAALKELDKENEDLNQGLG